MYKTVQTLKKDSIWNWMPNEFRSILQQVPPAAGANFMLIISLLNAKWNAFMFLHSDGNIVSITWPTQLWHYSSLVEFSIASANSQLPDHGFLLHYAFIILRLSFLPPFTVELMCLTLFTYHTPAAKKHIASVLISTGASQNWCRRQPLKY